jgi:hypothetical protein
MKGSPTNRSVQLKSTLSGAETSLAKERLHDESLTNVDRY